MRSMTTLSLRTNEESFPRGWAVRARTIHGDTRALAES
jgi:hypothetical protein